VPRFNGSHLVRPGVARAEPVSISASWSILLRSHIVAKLSRRSKHKAQLRNGLLEKNMVSHYGAQTPDARPQLCGPGAAPVFQKSSADA